MENFVREANEALHGGADLWVVTNSERSSWTQRIDWHLNFQLLRSQTHQALKATPALEEVMVKWDIEPFVAPETTDAPLLLPSSMLLPNHAVVLIPHNDKDRRSWVRKVHEIWSSLDSPKIRVFLPIGFELSIFTKEWPGHKDVLERALVPEAT